MYIFREKESLQKYLLKLRSGQQSIGYVPTMGALHEGHLSLINTSVAQNSITLCSIFVNPTQFNEIQDFEKYPIQVEDDIQKVEEAKVSILYLPNKEEVYPEGMTQLEKYDFGSLETLAEGAHRPGHFQGVAQVLSRFLKLIQPDKMYMGQKDYQQLLITKALVKMLGIGTSIEGIPIRREEDGLAMSSRNVRLSERGRKVAPEIYQSLKNIEAKRGQSPLTQLLAEANAHLQGNGLEVEYLMLAHAENLQPEDDFKDHPQILIVAAWLEGVRLIDNLLLT